MIRVQRIETDDPLYAQEVSLRTSVLLDPVGLSFAEYLDLAPAGESEVEHFVAVANHQNGPRVVGTATLYTPPKGANERFGKIQQVCVNNLVEAGANFRPTRFQFKLDELSAQTFNAS